MSRKERRREKKLGAAASAAAPAADSREALARATRLHQAGRLEEAQGIYLRVLKREPENADALSLMGLLAHQAGRNDVAAELLGKALAVRPRFANAHLNLGNVLRAEGDLEGAVGHFREAAGIEPGFPGAHNNLGLALNELGRATEAIPCFEAALRLDRRFADAHNGLGLALQALGRLDEARDRYQQALSLDANFHEAHNNLGTILNEKGEYEEALACFEKALSVAPDFADARVNLGAALQELGRTEEAIEAYTKALAARPEDAALHSALGAALMEAGEPGRAEAAFEQALAFDPADADVLINLGNARQGQGDAAAAIGEYERALAIRPGYAAAHRNIAIANLSRGDHDAAQAAFLDTVRANHGGPWWNAEAFRDDGDDLPPGPEVPPRASTFRLRDTIDQLDHLIAKGLIDGSFAGMTARYQSVLDEIERDQGPDASVTLTPPQLARIGSFYNRVIRYADAPRLAAGAVNRDLDYAALEESYLASPISITTFDDFMTPEGWRALREFCLCSTIFFGHSGARFVAADVAGGFNCGVLYQMAEELAARMPRVLGAHALTNIWVYRHRAVTEGVEAHTDQGAVTFNFWLTPEEANLDPEHGGIQIYAKEQPYDWDWRTYNSLKYTPEILSEINDFLASAETMTIPYRGNRAVLFHSNLFHKSDTLRFAEGFENRRMNVTMLFGKRGAGRGAG